MPQKIHGELSAPTPQPGGRLVYKVDGAVEGNIVYRCNKTDSQQLPRLGSPHPDDPTAVLHQIERVKLNNGLIEATCSYHGLSFDMGEQSEPIIEYPGAIDQLPIEVHPRFALIAGAPANPKNGARWVDPVTREISTEANAEFDGFRDPAFPRFFGTEVFYQNRPLVYRRYWSRNPPVLQQGCTIVDTIPGYTNPPGIVNWLLLDTPFQQVARNSYQITEQYKGSPAPGWNPELYRRS